MFPVGRVSVFARSAVLPSRQRALAPRQCSRTMATAQQLKARIVTVTNIGKITKAMKMVAAAKLRAVQARLAGVRSFQAPITNAYLEKTEYPGKKHLIVALTSDRGLCGAVNSAVVKAVKNLVAESKTKGQEVQILLTGEKGKAGLERLYKQYFCEVFTEVGKSRPVTFPEASLIAEYVLAQEFDYATIFYNQFKSAIAYNTTAVPFPNLQTFLADDDQFLKYETENEPFYTLADFHQYRLAVRLFHFFSENATSEQSARMTAMENSSKNSKEMLEKLRLQYNRTRQAKITTELIEIISGASSLKAAK